ncbi:tyrosine-type recombinase/integrase [Streptomyces sp. NPDC127039]|uniref:tyrosine-type recombinase/integrase n=1 Tax=Streptomyces sp. NPDC127039 TaxID=3347115 RepID=UPI00364BDD8D
MDGKGYAASSASTILAGTVVELRRRGAEVGRDDQAQARATLEAAAVELLKAGERRGRGQADVPDLYRVARACPDTLAGSRDKALVLTGFHYASRAQDPAGLLAGDVALTPRGLVVSVLTGKTKHSVRDAKINYQQDPEVCPVEAWKAYRAHLATDAEPRWSEPDAPAFVGVDRHGNVTGGMVPDSVTRAVKRISARAGISLAWTGHSLRIGLATTARKKGKDAVAIADQGGWARHSRSMNGYFQRVDGWEDNATAGLN